MKEIVVNKSNSPINFGGDEYTRLALLEMSISHINETLNRFDKKFDKIDETLLRMEKKFDDKFSKIDDRFDRMDKKFDNIEYKIDSNFKWLHAMIISSFAFTATSVVTVVGIMAHGFHWI